MSSSINPKVAPGGSAIGQAALGSAGTTATSLAGQGGGLFSSGQQKLNQSGNFFATLASGNRSATAQTLAPDVANINDVYSGTANTMSRFLRGPDKSVGLAQNATARAGSIANLFSGARTGANSALAAMGGQQTQTGIGAEAGSASADTGIANISQQAQIAQNTEQQQAGAGFGGLLFNILKSVGPAVAAPFTGGTSLAAYAAGSGGNFSG